VQHKTPPESMPPLPIDVRPRFDADAFWPRPRGPAIRLASSHSVVDLLHPPVEHLDPMLDMALQSPVIEASAVETLRFLVSHIPLFAQELTKPPSWDAESLTQSQYFCNSSELYKLLLT